MRVLHICDQDFAVREHEMLRRLEVGLIDEGVRVYRAVPRGVTLSASAGLAGELTYRTDGWRPLVPGPGAQIARGLAEFGAAAGRDEPEVDVVHAWGTETWTPALDVAEQVGCVAALEVWTGRALESARAIEARWGKKLAASGGGLAWLAPDGAMQAALQERGLAGAVLGTNWGVHMPEGRRGPGEERGEDADRERSVCIVGSGRDQGATMACILGLARAWGEVDRWLAFVDSAAMNTHHGVWKRCEQAGIVGKISLIEALEARRQLALRADVLALPERLGEHRTIVLESMAAGVPVVAREDPLVDALRGPERMIVVPGADEQAWTTAFGVALAGGGAGGDVGGDVGEGSRAYIRGRRLAYQQVAATLKAYSTLLGQEPYRLPGGRS